MGLFDFAKKKSINTLREARRENPDALDLLEFTLGENHCAVPVVSVREICQYEKLMPSGLKHVSIEGVFFFRDRPVAVVDLKKYLGMKKSEPSGRFIVVNTQGRDTAIHVSGVIGVNSVERSSVLTSPNAPSCVMGAVKIDNVPTAIFDFEAIVSDVFSV